MIEMTMMKIKMMSTKMKKRTAAPILKYSSTVSKKTMLTLMQNKMRMMKMLTLSKDSCL